MSSNQPNLSNLAAGLQNVPKVPNNSVPVNVAPSAPQPTFNAPVHQPQMPQVQVPRGQPLGVPQQLSHVQAVPQANNVPVPQGGGDTMTIFGQTLPKKYVYVIGALLLLAVAYYLYKYFNKGEDDEEDIDTEDDELNYMGPSDEMYRDQPNQDQLEKLQQMRQMQQQMEMQKMQKMQQMQQQMEMLAKMKAAQAAQAAQENQPVDQGIDEVEV